MADTALAQDYARALFEKAVERLARELRTLANTLERNRALSRLDDPGETYEAKQALIDAALPPQAAHEVRNLAYLLASKNQTHLLSDVVTAFEQMVARTARTQIARVISAIELTADERTRLEQKLRKQYGQDLTFDYRLDPSILGGVIVHIGDVVIDGSIAGKLAAMKQKLQSAI